MRIFVTMLVLLSVLCVTAQASVTFTPPGSTKPMMGNTFTMMPSSEATKIKSTAKVMIGMGKDQKTWMIETHVYNGHKNGLYSVWVMDKTNKVLVKPMKTDAKGHVKLSYMGTTNPMMYKSINVYYLPNEKAEPGKGAVPMFSFETKKIMPKGSM